MVSGSLTCMLILFSVIDDYPPRRADVVRLFFDVLPLRGVRCSWYFRNRLGVRQNANVFRGQMVRVAYSCRISGPVGKLVDRLAYWLGDIPFMVTGARGADIIQVRDKYFAAGLALAVARIARTKAVYWCSYPYPEHSRELAKIEDNLLKAMLRRLYGNLSAFWLHRLIMPRMDHVFVQSDEMAEILRGYGVPKEKMTAVPMGVPKSLLSPQHPARRATVAPYRVAYLGSMGRVRRLQTLIEAFALVVARIPQACLLMIGDGDAASELACLEGYAQSLEIRSSVEFTGQLPPEEAWLRLGEAAVCVSPIYPSPTLLQGSPTKLFEYMALGKPTVANDHPEQSAVLAESGAGICVPWNAQAFADAICDLLSNPAKGLELGARGPVWIAENRTYDRLADLLLAKYQQIVRGPEQPVEDA
jgi:glycosyltransferase involved in cell wall biosynthesis